MLRTCAGFHRLQRRKAVLRNLVAVAGTGKRVIVFESSKAVSVFVAALIEWPVLLA
jgi:hypothetical protein